MISNGGWRTRDKMPYKLPISSQRFLYDIEAAVRYPNSSLNNVVSWTNMRASIRCLNADHLSNNDAIMRYIRQMECHCDAQIAYWKTIQSFAAIARIRPPRYSNEYDDP